MKISSLYNFRLTHGSIDSTFTEELTKGLFNIFLQRNIKITFIPFIDNIDDWPFEYKYDEDSKESAWKSILLESRYIITPSKKMNGLDKRLSREDLLKYFEINDDELRSDYKVPTVFFISEKEFELFSEEAEQMFDDMEFYEHPNVWNTFVDDLEKKYELPKFIKNRVVNSPYLSDYELDKLRRKRDSNGNIVEIKIE